MSWVYKVRRMDIGSDLEETINRFAETGFEPHLIQPIKIKGSLSEEIDSFILVIRKKVIKPRKKKNETK